MASGTLKLAALAVAAVALHAGQHRGVVTYGGLALPGASVTASRGDSRLRIVTDIEGRYAFDNLADGVWTMRVEMQLFQSAQREVTVAAGAPEAAWEMHLIDTAQLTRMAGPVKQAFPQAAVTVAEGAKKAAAKPPDAQATAEMQQRAADGLLLNGSVNNSATSVFAQLPAFGNFRRGQRSLYNGNLGVMLNSSALDARSYSLTGQNTPKPAYRRVQGMLAFGGPLKIPHWVERNGPNITLNYQWARTTNARTQSGLVPGASQLSGDFSAIARPIVDPLSALPVPGNIIPDSRISAQARALARLFPLPNFTGDTRYNFQTALASAQHQDNLQVRATKQRRRNSFSGNVAMESTRGDATDLFGLLDATRVSGIAAGANYRRGFSARSYINTGVQFNRMSTRLTPMFASRENVSAVAGITGNNQDAINWGPPALLFSSGYSSLAPSQSAFHRNQTASASADVFMNRAAHNFTYGYTARRQQFNALAQQDARGTFTFTGAAAGLDMAGFLFGVPDASSIAFGNADKYLRGSIHEAFANDDWRVNPSLTANAGVRWEYWTPLNEKYARLVNLRAAAGFRDASAATGAQASLNADRNNIAPRIGIAWRPRPAAPIVVRLGYGIYYDTSVYQGIAMRMAQQAPLNKSLRVANSKETPLTLANGFPSAAAQSTPTFGVDPNLRIGYLHTWLATIQSDLPAALQMTANYTGSKGTRAQQQSLPNTFPDGAVQPAGFTYLNSNGNSTRHSAQLELRRRLRAGFTASTSYTVAKSIDNAMPRAAFIAQNWLDMRAERGLSSFDQRHAFAASIQYTSGMGLGGGTLAGGRLAKLWKEWTVGGQLNAASGLPLTPMLAGATPGTGVTGSLRPDYTGAPLHQAVNRNVNPDAFRAPAAGRWGNAGRNTIGGPGQFGVNASLSRTFRSSDRVSVDMRLQATNLLNHVTYPTWNTLVGSAQFGLPVVANPMRSVQLAMRMRF